VAKERELPDWAVGERRPEPRVHQLDKTVPGRRAVVELEPVVP
jgi:hypothetical protein